MSFASSFRRCLFRCASSSKLSTFLFQEHIVQVVKVIPHGRVHLRTGAVRSRARSSNHASGALSARIVEKREVAPVFQILEKVAPVAKLLLQHEIISREGRFQGACFREDCGTGGPCSAATSFFFSQEDCAPLPAPHMNSSFFTSSAHITQKKHAARELCSRFGVTSELQARETDAGSRRFCQASLTNLADATKGEVEAGTQRRPRVATEKKIWRAKADTLIVGVHPRKETAERGFVRS